MRPIQPLPWYVYVPNPIRIFQSPNIDDTRISAIQEQDSILKIGSVLQGERVDSSDVWLWCSSGIGFVPGAWVESTYYWNNSQWTYHLQKSYKPLTIDGSMPLLDNNQYLDPEQCVRRIGGEDLHTRYLIWLYWKYSRIARMNPIIPIAQSLLETGNYSSWWCTQHNNYAGIGVTGQTSALKPRYSKWVWDNRINQYREGIVYLTVADGIQSHIGRLLAYWYKVDDTPTPPQQALIQRAIGDRSIPIGIRGSLQHGIGALEGTWALDNHYLSKLLRKIQWLVDT